MDWHPQLALPSGDDPAYVRIAAAIAAEIRRGRLVEGERLPGTRGLADRLGVHRNTIVAAYRELAAQGWVRASTGAGTFVATSVVDPAPVAALPERSGLPDRPSYRLEARPAPEDQAVPHGVLALAGGRPDLRLVPTDALARAWRRGVRQRRALLDYGDGRGHPRLREALAGYLRAQRGMVVDADEILVTRGSQMALYLAARVLVRPGDRVAVEALGYGPAWEAFRRAGAELVGVPVDADGMDVDALAAVPDIRAVYCTPHHQFPTMAVLDPGRRASLLALAEARGLAIVEDDYDHEFHFAGRPVMPLASADSTGAVVYVGTLSKVLAPGLRIGYAVAPRAVIDTMVAYRIAVDRQGDLATEWAIAELIDDGELRRHLRRTRRAYAARQRVLIDALRDRLPDALVFDRPAGGLALWVRLRGHDADRVVVDALRAGVALTCERRYRLDGRPGPHLRIGFAGCTEDELVEAVDRLVGVLGGSS